METVADQGVRQIFVGSADGRGLSEVLAWMKEFRTQKLADTTVHIRNITLEGTHNNNKMERLNGEIRDREKVMRSLKKDDTPILTGMQIFHN